MHLTSPPAKTTQDPLPAQCSVLRNAKNLTCLALITSSDMDKKSKLKPTPTFLERLFSSAQPLWAHLLTLLNPASRKLALHQMTTTQTLGLLTLLTPTIDLKCKENPLRWVRQFYSVTARPLTTWPAITLDTETTSVENGKLCATHSQLSTRPKICNLKRLVLWPQTFQPAFNLTRTNGALSLPPMLLTLHQLRTSKNLALMTLLLKLRPNY